MPRLDLDDDTYERLLIASRLMGTPIADVINHLFDRLKSEPPASADAATWTPSPTLPAQSKETDMTIAASAPTTSNSEWLAVFTRYLGHRVEGSFNRDTHEIRLTTHPWENQSFPSPTAAAIAVVEQFSGAQRKSSNTNGRLFWKRTSTGRNLRSEIGQRFQ